MNTNSTPTPSASIDESNYLVARDTAREMLGGISLTHLRRLMASGDLKPIDLTTAKSPRRRGKLFFRVGDLVAFIERRALREPPPPPPKTKP